MICKLIKATVAPGCKDAFIERQRAWNDAMSRQPGFLGVQVATDRDEPDTVTIQIAMESRADLDRFMAGDHDDVMADTQMRALYQSLEIRVLDLVEPGPPAVRLELAPSRTASAHQVALLSELYRASALLRVAAQTRLFDAVGSSGATMAQLAATTGTTAPRVARLVEGLAALNLVRLSKDRVSLGELALHHLRSDAEGYLGDLVLHNTRPALWERWGGLGLVLGMRPGAGIEERDDHDLFLDAMTNIAGGGQATSLLAAVDLTGCQRLLDVGGGHGDYAVALCRSHPELRAVVLDQQASVPSTQAAVAAAGLDHRIEVRAADYREDLGEGRFDAVLLSNLLRGETVASAQALLRRLADAMPVGGRLLVQDLFPEDVAGQGPLLAAFFGLHLPDASNASPALLCEWLQDAGFAKPSVRPLDGWVLSNRLITARRAG